MVVTRSKSIVEKSSFTKTKRGSLGSLTSLTEKSKSSETDGVPKEKPMQASKSMEMDLDAISNEGESSSQEKENRPATRLFSDCSYQNKSHKNGHSEESSLDYKGKFITEQSFRQLIDYFRL